MRERLAERAEALRDPVGLVRRVPLILPVLLIPSWAFWFAMNRDDDDTDHILFFYMPDLVDRPLRLIPNLTVTPLVNTETDQVLLISGLIIIFGSMVERRLGFVPAIAIFWGSSALAAIAGAVLWHLLDPHFADFRPIERGGERVFNGASAGGFALMGAFAVTARWPLLWIGLWFAWEPPFWYFVSRDFTSVFHLIAFTTGIVTVRFFLYDRLMERRLAAGQPAATRAPPRRA